ncbi:C25 family cysteine peptidase [uncultured Pontibacter sp.]|uniref:putative type IX secretion system sortase PorU2 n=1 Tax=uncultured Pontibacter sp. TaxID=453356 RepID=UPI00261A5BBB|nr:C25 family cysteine peptidase [uncultured Pontibacter sp.]
MKRCFTAVLLLLVALTTQTSKAQELVGNEWIDYSKTYHKLQVLENGLYKLDYTYLQGLGLENVNPQHLQLFRRGKEVAIYVAGEADGRLDAQDFVEFYGERNDGVLDKELYKNPAHQVHQLHSMYTDSAAYFLTVNPAGNNMRMREVNPSTAGLTPEPYHLQKVLSLQTATIQLGQPTGSNRMPWMDRGEGYFSKTSTGTQSFNITGITNVVSTGPKPLLKYAIVGPDEKTHRVDINVVNGATFKINTAEYGGYDFYKSQQQLEFGHISSSSQITLQLVSQEVNGSKGAVALAYAEVTFPQRSVFAGKSMFLYTDSLRSATSYFEFTSAPASVVAYNVTDQQNIVRTVGYSNGTSKGFVVNGGQNQQKVLLARTDQALIPAGNPEKITFREINPDAYNYIIVTNKELMKPADGSSTPAPKEYAAYRSSAEGGGYDTLLVFIDDIADQFHYGEFSSNALTRFSSHLLKSPRQKYILYLGKSLELRVLNYKLAASRSQDLVPSGLGTYPGSDIIFSADFRNNNYEPRIPTGRVTAKTSDEIIAYLNKVKEYEAVKDGEEWRKNILQLGGGLKVDEINLINGYLNNYATIAEGPLLGASVIQKTRKNLSEVVETLDVSKEINEGVSLITFFGHSSSGTVDLDIGVPSSPISNYKNKGKYPVMIMNGCNLGGIFSTSGLTFGENWIKTPEKGAIAFIAHTDAGYVTDLNRYTYNFYTVALQDPAFYGKTIGEVQRETIRRVLQISRSNFSIAMVLEMVLQGDPAIKIYSPAKPDYLVKPNSFDLKGRSGSLATAVSDSVVLSFDAQNLGKAITDSIYVSVKRTLPDNTVLEADTFKVGPIMHTSRIELTLPNIGVSSMGINTFEVTLDSRNAFEELNEENNIAVYQRYISASGLTVVTPMQYSLLSDAVATLAVQAVVANKDKGVYFEIDTTNAFNSPWLKKSTNPKSGFASWDVSLINNSTSDSIVYFWRARFDSYEQGEDTVWVNSSFRRVASIKSGWSQSHRGQFTEAILSGMDSLNQKTGVWEFGTVRKFVDIKTAGGDIHFSDPPYGLFIDGNQQLNYWCGNPTYYKYTQPRFYLIAFNDVTLEPVTDIPGQILCTTYPYIFDTDDLRKEANITKLKSFIAAIPDGYYVAVIGMQNVPFSSFTEETKAAFRSLGSKLIDELRTGDPFVMMGRKGAAPGTIEEKGYSKEEEDREGGTPGASQSIALSITLESNRQSGTITSTTIGPALNWNSLHHTIKPYDGGEDKYKLSLIGVDAAGEETLLEENISSKAFDISHINASQYPNLKLSAFLADSTMRTAPQLKEWFVIYDPVPEGIIRPDLVKASSEDLTQLAGSGSMNVPMAFQNVTATAFTDSLTVEVVLSGAGISATTSRFKIKPLGPNETVHFSHAVSTVELDGDYRISFYVNPRLVPEQEYTNNIYEVAFKVQSKLHPVMDVAFDGIHILDGDIVSPSPLISVTVKDENRHIFLQDPAKMSMVLITPEGQQQEVDLMGNQEVTHTPATEANDFKMEYRPAKLEDGKYTMEVRAKDAAGKESGVSPYRIGFEVVSESSISNFYPFPNPFSTKTNFIFTITGSTIPDQIKIQILTITGKVVKEIMKEELGPLRIGNNKTEYAWDGTDMYGDRLANGVYLYRVVMSRGEEEMKHRNTFGDGAFKNGYGKLYILR